MLKPIEWMKLQVARHAPSSGIRTAALDRTRLAELGDDVYLGDGLTVTPLSGDPSDGTLLRVGDRVAISPNVSFVASMSPENSKLARYYGERTPIEVQDDVWIGEGATVLAGVTVGEMSLVAAGAVVVDDVPPKTVVGGVAAEKIKDID